MTTPDTHQTGGEVRLPLDTVARKGTLGITIEVLEYDPATATLVTVKPARHWSPRCEKADPSPTPRRLRGGTQ